MEVKGSTEVRTISCDKKSLIDLVRQSLQNKLDDLFESRDLLHYAWCVIPSFYILSIFFLYSFVGFAVPNGVESL